MGIDPFGGLFWEEIVWEFIEVESNILRKFIVVAWRNFLQKQIMEWVFSLEQHNL